MYDVASDVDENQIMCQKRKKTAAPATPCDFVRWKMLTQMHSPMRAVTTPTKPMTRRRVRPTRSTRTELMRLPKGQMLTQPLWMRSWLTVVKPRALYRVGP